MIVYNFLGCMSITKQNIEQSISKKENHGAQSIKHDSHQEVNYLNCFARGYSNDINKVTTEQPGPSFALHDRLKHLSRRIPIDSNLLEVQNLRHDERRAVRAASRAILGDHLAGSGSRRCRGGRRFPLGHRRASRYVPLLPVLHLPLPKPLAFLLG
jgi:hypothetical protein